MIQGIKRDMERKGDSQGWETERRYIVNNKLEQRIMPWSLNQQNQLIGQNET